LKVRLRVARLEQNIVVYVVGGLQLTAGVYVPHTAIGTQRRFAMALITGTISPREKVSWTGQSEAVEWTNSGRSRPWLSP
jgi:hypothetical protein